ncbi:MAG: DUF349 domain-containing protein [Thiotrichales bacterium]
MLRRLIKPKWKHKNPDIRRAAIAKIKDSQTLVELADSDPDIGVREAAISVIPDVQSLLEVNQDKQIDGCCAKRLTKILFETSEEIQLNSKLSHLISLIDDPAFFQKALSLSSCPQIRATAATRIIDQQILADTVLLDTSAEVRALCASRLETEALIRSILKKLPRKEKRTTKILKAKLEEIDHNNTIETQKQLILKRLEQLGQDSHWQRDQTTLLSLINHWEQLPDSNQEPLAQQYKKQLKNAELRIETQKNLEDSLAPVISEKESQCDFVEAYLDKLKQKKRISDQEARDFDSTLNLFAEEWQAQSKLPAAKENPLEKRFHAGLDACRQRVEELRFISRKTAHLESILESAERKRKANFTTQAELQQLKEAWEAQQLPEDDILASEYRQNFAGLMQRLEAKHNKDEQKKRQGIQVIEHCITRIESNISQDQLNDSTELAKKARNKLDEVPGLSQQERAAFTAKLNSFTPTIKTLEGWRHWGTERARENLIYEAEALESAEITVKERAESVKSLRAQWKNLGSIEAASGRALWKRFDEACNKAFEPCKAQFEAEDAARNKNLEERRIICDSLTNLIEKTDWSSPDWRQTDKEFRSLQARWRNCGPVNRRDWAEISEQYQRRIKALDEQLEPERKKNLEFRKNLIAQIEKLQEESDTRLAAEKLKALQKQWQITVSSKRGQEQKLWKQFKAAGDAAFNREKLRREAVNSEIQAALELKARICESLENLRGDNDLIKKQLAELEAQWHDIEMPHHRAAQALQKRFEAATDACHSEMLCNDLEAQRTRLEQIINHAQKSETVVTDSDEALEQLIKLEIALNLESAPENQQKRMEKQVELLSARLAENKKDFRIEEILEDFETLSISIGFAAKDQQRLIAIYEKIEQLLINEIAEIKQA